MGRRKAGYIPFRAIAVNDVAKMAGVRNCAVFEFLDRKQLPRYQVQNTSFYVLDAIQFAPYFDEFVRYITRLRSDRRITKEAFLDEYKTREVPQIMDDVKVELIISDIVEPYYKDVYVNSVYKIHTYKNDTIRLFAWNREKGWWTCLYSPPKWRNEKAREDWAAKFHFSFEQQL